MTGHARVRNAGVDLVRVIGVAAVVFGHVYGAIPAVHQWVYAWHVPLFFVLSGYFWRASGARRTPQRRTFADEFRIRARTLALPYVSWFLVIAVLGRVIPNPSGNIDGSLLIVLARGGSNATGLFGTFWFVSALFFTCLLYRLIDRLPWAWQAAIALVGLAAGIFAGQWLGATPLGIGQALPCVAFVMAGRLLRHVEPRLRRPVVIGGAAIAMAALLIAVVPMTPIDLKSGGWGLPLLGPLLAVLISGGMILVGSRLPIPERAAGPITALASVAIAVVLFHPYPIWLLNGWHVAHAVILLVALVVPWGVALLLRSTPLAYPLLGIPRTLRKPRVLATTPGGADAPQARASR
ncbi:acyltransferase family protein [Leifsonia sp. F6_8S_P_1B]|uniref:Acyltransferase family protein n=1 Tax=Leifsonia williamsii TaxID=3035919 RepID=A0ABT8KE73_9MICO|nr:acyltransferase family protein [Leifsonia williamsii]MDN4614762.1 acyltransferase family protein [Leifsonia williamsii]